jgi:hypothetical protein
MPILFLDEATGVLNTDSESLVQQSLDVFKMGKTAILLAHRLASFAEPVPQSSTVRFELFPLRSASLIEMSPEDVNSSNAERISNPNNP